MGAAEKKQNTESLEKVILAATAAQKKLDTNNYDYEKEMSSLNEQLEAPILRTPNLSQTLYEHDRQIKKELPMNATSIFPSKKTLAVSIIATAILGFALGAKIGLSVYYGNQPAETKVTIIDIVKTLF